MGGQYPYGWDEQIDEIDAVNGSSHILPDKDAYRVRGCNIKILTWFMGAPEEKLFSKKH